MARVHVILAGMPIKLEQDTDNYPVILSFSERGTYADAEWIVPSYPGHIPAEALSEIRCIEGQMSVVIDGPAGFQSGPHSAEWIRNFYPRGKCCAFIHRALEPDMTRGVSV